MPSLPWTRSRVLVVDENETLRQLLRQQLSNLSLASEGVSSGEAALELLRREHKAGRAFPIVLLDMHLADMDSVVFARLLRNDPGLADTKLIVMSSAQSPVEQETARSLGFSGTVTKPPQAEALYQCLCGLIEPTQRNPQRAA